MIPKIIHYCWLSGDPFPKHIEENISFWKEILPDYEFILWDKAQFDFSKSLWTQQSYENKKFAFASDFIRLYALYHFGGIYLDTDVEVIKPFDDLLDLPYFIGSQHNDLVEAAVIGAKKNSDWIWKCMQYYAARPFVKEDGSFDMKVLPSIIHSQTEPSRYLRQMDRDEAKIPYTLPVNKEILYVFPFDYFCTKNYETGSISITENTYTVHHFNSAWLPFYSKIRRKLVRTIGQQKTDGLIDLIGLRKIAKVLKAPTNKYRSYK